MDPSSSEHSRSRRTSHPTLSALDDAKEDDGIPKRSSVKIDGSHSARRCSRCGLTVRVLNPKAYTQTEGGIQARRAREGALQPLEAMLQKGRAWRASGGWTERSRRNQRKKITHANAQRTSNTPSSLLHPPPRQYTTRACFQANDKASPHTKRRTNEEEGLYVKSASCLQDGGKGFKGRLGERRQDAGDGRTGAWHGEGDARARGDEGCERIGKKGKDLTGRKLAAPRRRELTS
ncbi:hypothetical protein B0H19DRAFT_1067490 [Mycena capillaripes]|nr:hypothetical protein B0H19DRAFT_1067490 [Mycena capillaripes]